MYYVYFTVEFDTWNRRGFYFLILLYGTPPNTICWLALLHVWSLRATLSPESKYPMYRDEIYHLLSGEFTAMFLFQNWCNNNDVQNNWASKIIHFWMLHLLFCFKFLSQISRRFRPRTLEWSYYEHVWSLRATLSSDSKYPMHRSEICHLLSGEITAMFLFQNWCNNNDVQNITCFLNQHNFSNLWSLTPAFLFQISYSDFKEFLTANSGVVLVWALFFFFPSWSEVHLYRCNFLLLTKSTF